MLAPSARRDPLRLWLKPWGILDFLASGKRTEVLLGPGLVLSPNDLQGERSVSMFPQRVFITLENIWGDNFWIILLQSIWFSAINGPEIPPLFTTGFTCYYKWAYPWISWWQMVGRTCKQECAPSLFWEFLTSFYTLPPSAHAAKQCGQGLSRELWYALVLTVSDFPHQGLYAIPLPPHPETYSRESAKPHSQ